MKNSATHQPRSYVGPPGSLLLGRLASQACQQLHLLPVHVQARGQGDPILPRASGLGDEGRSLQSGPGKAAGASLSLVRDADLGTQRDAASLLGSALLVLGIISSVEDVMRFSPRPSDAFPGVGRMFFQLGYLLAGMGQYTRCSWRSGS